MQRLLFILTLLLLTGYSAVLLSRSIVYAQRTIVEFLSEEPAPAFLPNITACDPLPVSASAESVHLRNYRRLGAVCTKK